MRKVFLETFKKVIILFLVFVICAFSISCESKRDIEKPEKFYSQGEIAIVPNKLEVSLQNIALMHGIKLASSLENVTTFPSVYVKRGKDDTRIIKIKEDGNTVDTIVERSNSPLYQNAFIVESGGDLSKTIAQYVLYADESTVRPRNQDESFAVVNITLKNVSRKPIYPNDLKLTIKAGDKEERDLDLIISDVILNTSPPDVLEPGKAYSIRLIGLVPSSEKNFIFSCLDKRFKWEVK